LKCAGRMGIEEDAVKPVTRWRHRDIVVCLCARVRVSCSWFTLRWTPQPSTSVLCNIPCPWCTFTAPGRSRT
jgi:hypothetical protein